MDIKITASIICADYANMSREIGELNSSGVYAVHHDIMDGVFVPNITHGPDFVKSLRPLTKLVFDTHLMIINPEKYIKSFAEAGSDIITVHFETCRKIPATIKLIRECGAKAMIAVNPETKIEKVFPFLDIVDGILVMSVHPGFAGQKFIPEVLPKARKLKETIDRKNLNIDIQIDGGINPENIKDAVDAGVNFMVIGNALFTRRPLAEAVRIFNSAAKGK